MSRLSISPLAASLAGLLLTVPVGCNPDATPTPEPALSCAPVGASPRTIEVLVGTSVTLSAQCSFDGALEGARALALTSTLTVSGAETTLDELTFSDTGLLTLRATITPGEGAESDRGAYSVDAAESSLFTGRLFFHVSEATLTAEAQGAPGEPCLWVCEDAAGRREPDPFDGATCACSTRGVIASVGGSTGPELLSWSDALPTLGAVRVIGRVTSREGAHETTSVSAMVDVPGLDPASLIAHETTIVRNGNGEQPQLLWWGVTAAPGTPGLYAVRWPLNADGFGAPVVADASTIVSSMPPFFVSAMELDQPTDPTAAPRPMVLYGYQTPEGPMAWALVELFYGDMGTGAAVFADSPTWAEVTPEDVESGTASVGLARLGTASGDPHRGVAPATDLRAWSVRPDPADAGRVLVSLYDGSGALTLDSAGSLPLPGRACWKIGPAPGGFLVSRQPLSATGASPSATSPMDGIYFASAVDATLGLAPLHDPADAPLYADTDALDSCAPTTPSAWPGLTMVDDGGATSLWVPSERAKRPGAHFLSFQVAGSTAPAPGASDPISATAAVPLRFEDPRTPGSLPGTARAMAPLSGSRAALTAPLDATTCTSEAPCTRPLLNAADIDAGFSMVFTGTAAPTVAARFGEQLVGSYPLAAFDDPTTPPSMFSDSTGGLFALVADRDTPRGLAILHATADGRAERPHPLDFATDTGPVLHAFPVDGGALIFVRGDAGGGITLERAERAELVDLADGVSAALGTTPVGMLDATGLLDPGFDPRSARAPALRSFAAQAMTGGSSAADASVIEPGEGLAWAAILEGDAASGCGATALLLGAADGSVMQRSLSEAPADGSCEGVERGALVGDFLGHGGRQILTQRVEGATLSLRLWYVGPEGVMAMDYARVDLPYVGAPLRVWGGDLDGDGLADAMLDVGSAEGVLVGFSDGLGGARDGVRGVSALSDGLTFWPGPAPGIMAHFGKGTTNTSTTASAKPELL